MKLQPGGILPKLSSGSPTLKKEAGKTEHLLLSATVFDRQVTLLRWSHEGEEYEAVSGADFNFLTGFSSVKKGDKRFSMLMMGGNSTRNQNLENALKIPEGVHSGIATFVVTKGDATNAKACEAISVLHELYRNEGNKLRQAYFSREKKRKEREAELRANPAKPKNITLNYWKIQPKKEGSAQ
jgi:hypothetical protein